MFVFEQRWTLSLNFLRKVSEGCIFVAALLVNSNNKIEVVPAYSKISLLFRGPMDINL
jgi:hypothetical protein